MHRNTTTTTPPTTALTITGPPLSSLVPILPRLPAIIPPAPFTLVAVVAAELGVARLVEHKLERYVAAVAGPAVFVVAVRNHAFGTGKEGVEFVEGDDLVVEVLDLVAAPERAGRQVEVSPALVAAVWLHWLGAHCFYACWLGCVCVWVCVS